METKLGSAIFETANGPYARFYDEQVNPPQPQVSDALTVGPMADDLFPGIADAPDPIEPGYRAVESGFTFTPDFGIRGHCLTKMPRVTPEMWGGGSVGTAVTRADTSFGA